MATPQTGQQPATKKVRVHIGLDVNGNIAVDPDTFWVYRCEREEVQWVCVQHHTHGDCFTVDFDPKTGSPFKNFTFKGHDVLSDLPTSGAKDNTVYKYTINIGGKTPLDPGGGVRP